MKPIRKTSDFDINTRIDLAGTNLVEPNNSEEDAAEAIASSEELVKFDKNTLTWTTPQHDGFICGIFKADEEANQ